VKISYLITTHNEPEFQKVFGQVFDYCNSCSPLYRGDEVVILDDFSTDERMQKQLALCGDSIGCKVVQHSLNGDFGAHKTFGSRQCKGDFIVQLDADEYLFFTLLENLHELLDANPKVELYRVPRVNIVRGMTPEDARKWGWHVSELPEFSGLPIINWNSGDYQARIYKNDPKIYWHKPLHETITGAEYVTALPLVVDCAIIHDKTIDRQRAQNEFYMKNWSVKANMGQG
jgi:glycosyltransferase involved in cell wall biosynthesis